MTKTQAWVFGTAALCVALLAAAWFLVVGPVRSDTADLRDRRVAQDGTNQAIRTSIKQLKAQYADLPARQAELAQIRQEMPPTAALPTLIRDLTAHAKAAGVTLTTLSPGAPKSETGTSQVPAASGAPAGGTKGGAAPAATADAPVLAGIPTQVIVEGDFASATLFLQKVQSTMKRAYLVEGIQVAVGKSPGGSSASGTGSTGSGSGAAAETTESGDVIMTLTGKVFVLRTPEITTPAVPAAG